MRQRGRKSAAALSVVRPITDSRPAPPEGLTATQQQEWRAIVNRLPHDWFGRETHALLADFCRRVERQRMLADQIDEFQPEWLRTDDGLDRYDRLTRLAERETRAMVALARSLRLTNQSRYTPHGAAAAAQRAGKCGTPPWEYAAR